MVKKPEQSNQSRENKVDSNYQFAPLFSAVDDMKAEMHRMTQRQKRYQNKANGIASRMEWLGSSEKNELLGQRLISMRNQELDISKLSLEEQFEYQIAAMWDADMIEVSDMGNELELGIPGVDEKFYGLPDMGVFFSAYKELPSFWHNRIEEAMENGYSQLRLVPFAKPLFYQMIDFDDNVYLLSQQGKVFNSDQKQISVDRGEQFFDYNEIFSEGENDGRLIYFPKNFSATSHKGFTKSQIIQNCHINRDVDNGTTTVSITPGWHVFLIRPADLEISSPNPPGETASECLKFIQNSNPGMVGWTPELWLANAITTMHEQGLIVDDYTTTNVTFPYLLGTYMPQMREVAAGYWSAYNHGGLHGAKPNDPNPAINARYGYNLTSIIDSSASVG